jgi:hypothetical protein
MMLMLFALASLGPVQDQGPGEIDKLIQQLGADDFQAREKASEALKKIGRPAEEALRKAAESPDAEVRTRAKEILEHLARGEKPAPPAEKPRRAPRALPGFPGAPGFRGSSVVVSSVNGDTTYKIVPGDGQEPITFEKKADGSVKLEYKDEKGESRTAGAGSIEKFAKDHQALAQKYGISEDGIDYAGARASFKDDGGGFGRGFNLPPGFGFGQPGLGKDAEDLEALLDQVLGGSRGRRAGGATLEGVSEALRAQLGLAEGEGLVVTRVAPGGEAESAGLQKNDILLEIDGKKVSSLKDVRENLKKSSSLAVLRKGKRETLKPAADRKDY